MSFEHMPWGNVSASVPLGYQADGVSSRPTKSLMKQHTILTETTDVLNPGDMRFECSVCLGEYNETGDGVPRSLLCGHTFCTGCLIELVKESNIRCPKCHHNTPISSHGVKMTLVKNYGVLEIIYSHPSSYKTNAVSTNDLCITDLALCDVHGDRLTSFCVKDKVLVCSSCLLYGEHKDHPCQLVKDAGIEYRQRLRRLIPDVLDRNDKTKGVLVDVKRMINKVQDSSEVLGTQVDVYFDRLLRVLEKRMKELKLEILHRTQERVEALSEQARSLDETVVVADDCLSSLNGLMTSSDHHLLQNYSILSEKMLLLFGENSVRMEPEARDNLRVTFPPADNVFEDFQEQFKNHGTIQSEVSVIDNLLCDSFHDGFRIYWQDQNIVDSEGCTYVLHAAIAPSNDYSLIYRGGDTKFTYRRDDLRSDATYKFRVRVQTTGSFGAWSQPIDCHRAPPNWLWDKKRRNFKIDISDDCLEVSSKLSSGKHWASVSGDKVFLHYGCYYMEIKILELAKHRIHKNWFTKLALGVIQSSESSAKDIPWQDDTNPIGRSTADSYQDHNSWGYIVTSGVKVSTTTGLREEEYGTDVTLEVGDRIGMLINVNDQEPSFVSFFYNGSDLGVAYKNLSPPLIPVLSVCDKFSIRLCFPPTPYTRRDPRLTMISSGYYC